MKGLDLSRLKKVASDEKTTTFKHANGHMIKIAHAGLSPKILEDLKSLKMANGGDANQKGVHQDLSTWGTGKAGTSGAGRNIRQGGEANREEAKGFHRTKLNELKKMPKPKLMAEGGVTDSTGDDEGDDSDDSSQPQVPVSININAGPQPNPQPTNDGVQPSTQAMSNPPVPAQYTSGTSDPGPVATTGNNPSNPNTAPDQSPAPQMPARTPAAVPQAPAQPQVTPQQAHTQQLMDEDAACQHAMAAGQIRPETYHDLFAKKDTLGKVGTLFGMLLSGAGSGLSHQPNAVMSMMNQEIQNDMEAQKTTVGNAQSYLKLMQQHLMNQAQVKQMNQETQIKSIAMNQMLKNRAAFQAMVDNVNRMPEGPQKQAGQNTLAMMFQGINNENFDIASRAGAASALANFGNQSDQNGNPEQGFQQRQNMLRMSGNEGLAKNAESKHIPGFQGQASADMSPAEKDELTKKANFDKQLGRFVDWAKQHNNTDPADIATVNQGRTLARLAQNAYRESSLGTVYKAQESPLLDQIIPEDPGKFLNQWRVVPQLEALRKENISQLNDEAKSKGFKGYQATASEGAPQYKIVNGVKYMRGPNGEAIKVK